MIYELKIVLREDEVNDKLMNPIKIFYHIYAWNGTWKTIVPDQLSKLMYSGLLKKSFKLYVYIVGPEGYDCAKFVGGYPNVEIIVDVNNQTAERVTLLGMRQFIKPDDYVLYLHSKGVTKTDFEIWLRINDWRNLMEYHLIYRHEECLEKLKEHDVIGVNRLLTPSPHFSGNFWWAKASYVLSLPETIGGNYLDPEQYVLSQECWTFCMYESETNHYENRFPISIYYD